MHKMCLCKIILSMRAASVQALIFIKEIKAYTHKKKPLKIFIDINCKKYRQLHTSDSSRIISQYLVSRQEGLILYVAERTIIHKELIL